MAKLIFETEEAGVRLLDFEISEDELAVLVAVLDYLLHQRDDGRLERACGAARDEVEGLRHDLSSVLDTAEREILALESVAAD
ncbi:MAG: hypothetical protein HY784_14340 [Chloroflexi bacterium]|nr:hypothetical protein [Chloroflexota bacterium]